MTTGAPVLVTVNGSAHAVTAGTSLSALLEALGKGGDTVATAVNGDFVARGARPAAVLQPGDRITCFQPIVGG